MFAIGREMTKWKMTPCEKEGKKKDIEYLGEDKERFKGGDPLS